MEGYCRYTGIRPAARRRRPTRRSSIRAAARLAANVRKAGSWRRNATGRLRDAIPIA